MRLVYGVGVNDADYDVRPTVGGARIKCNIYSTWASMLERCYSGKYKQKKPTYIGCAVCKEWHLFSNFKRWMETQDWKGKQLDKDILFVGNKIYSPETCVFVEAIVNSFTTGSDRSRGDHPIGVSKNRTKKKFQARCGNPFTKMAENLGEFYSAEAAHLAWKKRKHELACQLAELQTDERVASALRARYA